MSTHDFTRGVRALLLALVVCALAACGDEGSPSPEPAVSDVTDAITADAQSADQTDGGDAALADVVDDAGPVEDVAPPPPFDCPGACAIWSPIIFGCFSSQYGPTTFDLATHGMHPDEAAVGLVLADASAELQQSVLALAGDRAELRVRSDEAGALALLDGVNPCLVTPRLEAHPDVVSLLPALRDVYGRQVVITGRLVLRLNDAAADIEEALDGTGAVVRRAIASLPGVWLAQVAAAPLEVFDVVSRLRAQPGVAWAEIDGLRPHEHRATDDPYLGYHWHLEASHQPVARPESSVMSDASLAVTTGDPEVILAIFDDGVDAAHLDLASGITGGLNLPDSLPDALEQGCCLHGTAVAGVAAARGDNAIGGRGLCPDCAIMPIHEEISLMEDSGIAQDMIDAVDDGAAVINNSWGIGSGNPALWDEPQSWYPFPPEVAEVIDTAFTYAETIGRDGLGTVIVFAAGNSNDLSYYDGYVHHPLTLSVAATDDQGWKSEYSSFGDYIDVAAPSSGGLTAGIFSPAAGSPFVEHIGQIVTGGGGDAYVVGFGGTSSAAPLVTGVAGMVISANPALTAAEVRQVIRDSADKVDRVHGAYLPNGMSSFYGAGRVNVHRAVVMARSLAGGCDPEAEDLCNGVDDDCDGDIDPSCDRGLACDPCVYDAGCESSICSRTPHDTDARCLDACDAESPCAEGYVCQLGLCLPDDGRCAPCADELCNDLDDDCDGVIDEDGVCPLSDDGVCVYQAECGPDGVCLQGECEATCDTDDDCENSQCTPSTDRWGAPGVGICPPVPTGMCVGYICGSDRPEEEIVGLFNCWADAEGDCDAIFACLAPWFGGGGGPPGGGPPGGGPP